MTENVIVNQARLVSPPVDPEHLAHKKYVDDQNQVTLRDDVTPYLSGGDYYTAFQTFISETEDFINAGIPNYKYVYDPESGENP